MNELSGISVIVPIYNEEKTLVGSLDSIKEQMAMIAVPHEIIVINDGSRDETKKLLANIRGITTIEHRRNKGYSASLKTGILRAQYDWILTMDADGSHPASSIDQLIARVGDVDLIIGARTGDHDTFARRIGRHIIANFASYITGIKIPDINSGFRLFKKSLVKQFWPLFPERYSFSTTLTVASHIAGYEVAYVPIMTQRRQAGKSSIKPGKDFFGFLSIILRLAIYFRPLKIFIPTGLGIEAAAIIIVGTDWIIRHGFLDTTFSVLTVAALETIFFGLVAEMIVKRFYSTYPDGQ